MKKLTLVCILCALFSLSYGQKFTKPGSIQLASSEERIVMPPQESRLKAEGNVILSETFDFANPADERGWTLPAGWLNVDETDLGNYWTWRAGDDSIKGKLTFLPGHPFSKTPEDGYFVLPMDEYNYRDGVSTGNAGFAWFQMPPIDCSAYSSIIMSMSQYFRACCALPDVKVQISNDEGVHWAVFDMRYGVPGNKFCNKPYPEFNISVVAAGMPSVLIRIVWNTDSHYFWCIDDIKLFEGYGNELELEDAWFYLTDLSAENQDEGFAFMVPNFLTGGDNNFGGYTFRGAVANVGFNDQDGCRVNAEVFKNGISVYNQNSDARSIWAVDRDSFDVTTPFNPSGYGDYKMVLTAQQDQTDGRPENNVRSDTYYITDSVYSYSDWELEMNSSTASWGNNDGDMLGCVYDISKPCEVNSMTAFVMQRRENPRASTQIGYTFQYFIYEWNEEAANWIERLTAAFTEVTAENLNTFITIPMDKDGESEFLEPGQYIAAVQGFHGGGQGPDNNIFRFTLGGDVTHKTAVGKSVFRNITGDTWSTQDTDMPMIRMNINQTGAPSTADVVLNVDMTLPIANGNFKPASDFVDVTGTFNSWGSTQLADGDGDGIYTLTVPAMPVFQQIEYLYRINGTTSEALAKGANRTYRISFYNVVNNVFNDGVSLDVELDALTPAFTVYPNPSDGVFTLNLSSPTASDLDIRVVDLQGKVVYEKTIRAAVRVDETIDLTTQAQGIYFLKINNQVTKLVVK